MPAVVNISVELKEAAAQGEENRGKESARHLAERHAFDQFLKRFFEQPFQFRNPAEKVMALGSGFIIKMIGRDEKTDIALLKIGSNQKLPYVTWGNSDDAKVGDWVVAVSNSFGLGGSVTAGIISALGRDINEGPYDDFLQIDAPIKRGNSGGPTFNLHGQVIGINTATYSPSGGWVGIGFVVPSNIAKQVVVQRKEHGQGNLEQAQGSRSKRHSGDRQEPRTRPRQRNRCLVDSVTADSPAAKAGIEQGDVFTAAGGHEIKTLHDLPRPVAATPVGGKLPLTIMHDGKLRTVEATIGETPQNVASEEREAAPPGSGKTANDALGMKLLPLEPQLRRELKVPKNLNGVVVGQVASGSPESELGIHPGDVIVSVDQRPVTTPEGAAAQLKQVAAQGNVPLLRNRHGMSRFVGLSVENNGTAGSSR